jgi:hypothetical protein
MSDRRKILKAINAESRRIRDPKARRVFRKAAVETGIVESGLSNPSYGDADSQGWRQERASLYKDPTNITASVRRFRQEFEQHYQPGERSYQVAADVQRPAAQYRGRYKDVAGQASRILAGQPNVQQGTGYTTTTTPGVDNSPARQALQQAYLQNRHDPNALLDLAAGLGGAQDTPSTTTRIKTLSPQAAQTGSALVGAVKAEADQIDKAHVGYQWGGGHGAKQARGSKVTPVDCSGAVSRVLGINPRVSGEFEKWGKPGRGKVTVYANKEHVLMEINGHFFGTSASNPGGGPGWIPRKKIPPGSLKNFTARHP